jgi:hypothetical protein
LFGCHGRYSRPGVRYLFFVGANPNDTSTKNYVSPGPGTLALNDVTLEGGLAQGGGSDLGGGGAGMGGAIFNQGTVVIDDSTLTDNVAQGGNAGDTSVGSGGGGIGTDASASGGGGGVGGGGGQGDPNSFGEGGGGGFGGGGGGGEVPVPARKLAAGVGSVGAVAREWAEPSSTCRATSRSPTRR